MRVDRLRENMTALQADAALITAPENVTYYSGFTGVSSQLLVTPTEVLFFTDFRYVSRRSVETDCDVVETQGDTRIRGISTLRESGACAARRGPARQSFNAYRAYLKHIARRTSWTCRTQS